MNEVEELVEMGYGFYAGWLGIGTFTNTPASKNQQTSEKQMIDGNVRRMFMLDVTIA